jgi:hypothetical protein
VIVPEDVIGLPETVRPVVPPETATEVTVPVPAVLQSNAVPFQRKNVLLEIGAVINDVTPEPVLNTI